MKTNSSDQPISTTGKKNEYGIVKGTLPILVYCFMTIAGLLIYYLKSKITGNGELLATNAVARGILIIFDFFLASEPSLSYEWISGLLFTASISLIIVSMVITCFYRKNKTYHTLSLFGSLFLGMTPVFIGLICNR